MPAPRFLNDKFCSTARAKRERRKKARPKELLEAALDLFVDKGFAATRAENENAYPQMSVPKMPSTSMIQAMTRMRATLRDNVRPLSGRGGARATPGRK